MGIGISVFLIAVGAILKFAVEVSVSGVDIDTVGVILMIAGAIGLVWSLIVMYGTGRPVVADDAVDAPVATRRRFVRRDPYVG